VGRDGDPIQTGRAEGLDAPRFMVLFHFVNGDAPDESGDITDGFEELGAIAARCHEHVLEWKKPANFERLTWDAEAVFGPNATWGNWRDAPEVTPEVAEVLERVEATVRARLDAFGKSEDRFNLIHADMRLANLLVDENGTRLIDFDDCGWGYFLYDFAAAISFIEDDPRIPAMKAAWVHGYRSVRAMSDDEEAEIDTFVMLRRMALLAWIGSHIEAPEPQELAPGFAATTARLGQDWMSRVGEGTS
jgi:Ser/Thr protein kinase RdoA (MazF antagonist)